MYNDAQRRIESLVNGADAEVVVPACPGWSVENVIAHLTGLADDVVNGRVDGYASEGWTAAQVSKRHGQSLDELFQEWRGSLNEFAQIMADIDGSSLPEVVDTAIGPVPRATFKSAFLVDLIQHEHDLRGALGVTRSVLDADTEVLDNQVRNLRNVFAVGRLPTLLITATDTGSEWAVGRDDPSIWLNGSTIDLLRSLGGRRTVAEIGDLDWSGDHGEVAERIVLPFFSAPVDPIAGG